jgi:hypothetical protein
VLTLSPSPHQKMLVPSARSITKRSLETKESYVQSCSFSEPYYAQVQDMTKMSVAAAAVLSKVCTRLWHGWT